MSWTNIYILYHRHSHHQSETQPNKNEQNFWIEWVYQVTNHHINHSEVDPIFTEIPMFGWVITFMVREKKRSTELNPVAPACHALSLTNYDKKEIFSWLFKIVVSLFNHGLCTFMNIKALNFAKMSWWWRAHDASFTLKGLKIEWTYKTKSTI